MFSFGSSATAPTPASTATNNLFQSSFQPQQQPQASSFSFTPSFGNANSNAANTNVFGGSTNTQPFQQQAQQPPSTAAAPFNFSFQPQTQQQQGSNTTSNVFGQSAINPFQQQQLQQQQRISSAAFLSTLPPVPKSTRFSDLPVALKPWLESLEKQITGNKSSAESLEINRKAHVINFDEELSLVIQKFEELQTSLRSLVKSSLSTFANEMSFDHRAAEIASKLMSVVKSKAFIRASPAKSYFDEVANNLNDRVQSLSLEIKEIEAFIQDRLGMQQPHNLTATSYESKSTPYALPRVLNNQFETLKEICGSFSLLHEQVLRLKQRNSN